MSSIASDPKTAVHYPEQNGEPLAESTLQFRWIATLQGGIAALFWRNPSIFVAGDLLWYPVEGDNTTRQAPDVMVVFGRPKGDRGSYRQWDEGGLAPQVVFEVLSPGNRPSAMARKLLFYERFGVEEYYIYDPDRRTLEGYVRSADGEFDPIKTMHGHVSPRLGIRFDMSGEELVVYRPDGKPFSSYVELMAQAEGAEAARRQVQQENERLRARLRALGVDPDAAG